MKKLLLAAALAAVPAGVYAADLPAKAPSFTAPVPAAYDWTGFYAGVNAGVAAGGEGRSGLDVLGPGGAFETFNLASLGAVGGAQAGYNYQFGNFVVGAEADIQGITRDGSTNCILTCNGLNSAAIAQNMSWFGTVRGRVGYASGPILNYFTGGFAYGGVKVTSDERLFGVGGSFASSQTRTGFVLGSGIEAAVGGNWTAKVEYLYVDLGAASQGFVIGGRQNILGTENRESIFRAGVNYRIGGKGGFYSLTPAANWTGFYAGGNGGSGIARDATTHTVSTAPTLNNSFDLAPRGFNGGVQAGYNWQRGNVVYGLETDFQGSTQVTDRGCLLTCTPGNFAAFHQKLDWFGTVRGRVGYGVGPTLFYATAGLAYGEVRTRVNEVLTPFGINNRVSFGDTRAGYAVGGGVETPLEFFDLLTPGRWTVKTEYLYIDLGSSSNSYNLNGIVHTLTTEETNHIFRTGVNYQFDAPVAAKF